MTKSDTLSRSESTGSIGRKAALRVVLGLLLAPVAFVLAAPESQSLDFDYRHQAGFGNRLITLHRQVEAIARGHYLADESGGSFTRDAAEVVGPNLLLANAALVRSWLGRPPPTFDQMLRWQSHLASLAVLAMLASGTPLWTVGVALLLLWLFPNTPATLAGQRAWPQLLTVALAVGALASLSRWIARERPRVWALAGMLLLALCAGGIGHLRDEARFHFLAPLLGIAAATAGAALLRLRTQRDAIARVREAGLAAATVEMRIGLAVAVMTAGVVATTPLRDLNLLVFEAIEDVEHRPKRGWHLFWHPLYLGLGFDFHTQEHLAWLDPIAVADAHAATGSFSGFDASYEAIVRDRFLEIAWRNTPFFAHGLLHKLRVAFFGTGRPKTMPLLALATLLAGASCVRLRGRAGDPQAREACLLLGGAGLVGVALAPGLMAGSEHLHVLDAALIGASLLAAASLAPRALRDRPDPEPSYPVCLARVLGVAAAVALVGLAALCWRVIAVERHRGELTAALASGDLRVTDLLSEYHVDASRAFNALPQARRTALARELAAREEPLDAGVRLASARGSSKIRAAVWTERALFLWIEVDRLVRVPSLSLRFEFREPALVPVGNLDTLDFSPPHTGVQPYESLKRNLYLPVPMERGPWLFSIRAPRAHLDAIEINAGPLRVPLRAVLP